jgi:hypothetical protein
MPALLAKWVKLDALQKECDYEAADDQQVYRRNLIPLLECIGCVAVACKGYYEPFAAATLATAMSSIEHNVLRVITMDAADENDSDVIVCCLDIIDGLTEAFEGNFQQLLGTLPPQKAEGFLPLIQQAASFKVPSVRMSAFALVGDLCKYAPGVLQDALSEIFKLLLDGIAKNLDQDDGRVLNNVLWATGELFVRCRNPAPQLQQILAAVQPRLVPAIWGLVVGGQIGISENASVTLGRMAMVDGTGFGVHSLVREDLFRWLGAIGNVRDRGEKCDGFSGCIATIMSHPEILLGDRHRPGSLSALFVCIAAFHIAPDEHGDYSPVTDDHFHQKYMFEKFPADMPELHASIVQLLSEVKRSLGAAEFDKVKGRLPRNVARLLIENYSQV